ncbi:MAG: lipid IV(A) 3-deoxy-D-manno-octulosonic acid transferase [Betaproteobacteria bacterium]|nr:lipid IV(A) 3-deoxy-D-manno-octulosonic acid transferase [Betaproteobacteria bacterium]
MRRRAYTLLLFALLPLALLHLVWRARRQPAYLRHVAERFGFYRMRPARPVIWLHAVSVGETRAAGPLVHALRARYPGYDVLLTHTTPTGRETSESLFGQAVARAYLPYDFPFAMRRFLRHFRPTLGILMETEIWFNLAACARQARVPLILANARLSEKSFRRYARVRGLARPALQSFAQVLAQSAADAERLARLGARPVVVAGNLKFDVEPPAGAFDAARALKARFGAGRPVFLAASTREGEEALILEAMERIAVKDLLVVIVPRHPQRFDEVARLVAGRGLALQRKSLGEPIAGATQIVLGDTMGELFAYYGAADLAFIGGSLMPLGGQNLIEAAAMGVPVLVGPHTFNFEEPARAAVACGCALRIADADDLGRQARALLADAGRRQAMHEAALGFAASRRGATESLLGALAPYLKAGA